VKNRLAEIFQESQAEIQQTADLKALEDLKVKILGRKGLLTSVLHQLSELPPEERPAAGEAANRIKTDLSRLIDARMAEIKQAGWLGDRKLRIDPTLPGKPVEPGHLHLINRVSNEIEEIFKSLGFSVAEGPEVENDYYNFEAMNFPSDHPSREMHDTFFFSDKVLLRTHTSPVQVRYMEKHKPPFRVIMPGKTYRCDDDATHSPMFQQVEGLMVDRNVSFSNLKAVLTLFIQRMFGEDAKLRFRPSFFPFTEPSAEVDMSCVKCKGKGCSLCKQTGWIEILGSGMVHPNVLRAGGIDPEVFSGFAFGMGIERITMLKYNIDNMRYFYENDLRFLEQF
jgi:phenylalanyl-tRNA synthetase alpha chain